MRTSSISGAIARRLAVVGAAVIITGSLGAAASALGPPKPPPLCSIVSKDAIATAIGTPVPLVLGHTVTGRSAIKALAKQADLAVFPIFQAATKVTICVTGIMRGAPPSPSAPPSTPTLNLLFFNNATRRLLATQEHSFRVESGSGAGAGIEHNTISDVPGVGTAAFSVTTPALLAGEQPAYDVYVLVGSTEVQVSVAAPTAPDPTTVDTLAGMIATALHGH
jgi:hypothetical protein